MPDIYGFRVEMREEEIGHGVVGFEAFRHCLTALVMAIEETQHKRMVNNTTWTLLYLLNKALEEMPRTTERRWGLLSRYNTSELSERWRDPHWPEDYRSVDKTLDEEDPPF